MMTYKTAFVLSDTHGWFDLMLEQFAEAGITDQQGKWIAADDVQLIHLGDTVDRGPESAKTFTFLRDLQASRPDGQVIRLIGNHEFAYCGGPTFYGADLPEVKALVPAMVEDGKSGKLGFAHALTAGETDWLLVHGGLDRHWNSLFGETPDVKDIAEHINGIGMEFFQKANPRWRFTEHDPVVRAEQESLEQDARIITEISYVRGGYGNVSGVTWCDMIEELRPSEAALAVNQIVGHRSHPHIEFSKLGRLVGVNVHYGYAQLLRIDLESGEMTVTERTGSPWDGR